MPPGFVVRITPADVGRRVSVRSRLGAGFGTARYTDTVGHLRAWSDGELVIETRNGTIVALREADVVAARVVPPPPRRREPGR